MPYFNRTDHLSPLQQGGASSGPPVTMLESFNAQFTLRSRVGAEFAAEAEFARLFEENRSRAMELSGVELPDYSPSWDALNSVIRRQAGDDPANTVGGGYLPADSDRWLREHDAFEAQLRQLQAMHPEVKTTEQLLDDLRELRRGVEQEAAQVGERGGLAEALAGFAGGMAGSFTYRDPTLVLSMLLPTGGATLARRIATDAVIGGGVEGVVEGTTVQPMRESLGEQPTSVIESMLLAAAGGAVFRGGLEGVPIAYRRLEERLYPNRAVARELNRLVESGPVREAPETFLARLTETRNLTPEQRSAVFELEGEVSFARANPYGNSPQGRAAGRAELEAAWRAFEELPAGRPSRTAVARFLPEEAAPDWLARGENPRQAIARFQRPDVYARVDAAEERLAAAELRVAELEERYTGLTVEDAVERFDPMIAQRMREVRAELEASNTPTPRRQELNRELDLLASAIPEPTVARMANDMSIGPRRELRDAKRGATRARKEANAARRAAQEVEGQVKLPAPQEAPVQVVDAEVARATATKLAEEAPTYHTRAEQVVTAPPRADGIVNIDGVEMREDFRIVIDEAGNTMSVRDILNDLADDDQLLTTMRSCRI